MDQIRICNLRCLADTGTVDLKPITLLVGANSSGKSSFLRVFPLLRQSIETRTVSGLLLNEGDVNFGFFHEALHRDASPAELKLEFSLILQPGIYQGVGVNRFLLEPLSVVCGLTYSKRNKDPRYPFLASVRLSLGSKERPDVIEISADEDGKVSKFIVNEYHAEIDVPQLRLRIERGLVPTLIRVLDEKDAGSSLIGDELTEAGLLEQKLLAETDDLFHGRTANDTRLATLLGIRIGSPEQMLASTKQLGGVSSWQQRVQNWTIETPIFRRIRNLLLAKSSGNLLSSANLSVSQLARSVHYFQPVRASVQRDYQSRDVQIESVDPTGLNVAMVLASLGGVAQGKFREWMRKHFGFEIFPQSVSDGARVALRMKEESSGAEFNLADMGFGFSQMLPFLVEIWHLAEHQPTRKPTRFISAQYRSDLAIPRNFLIAVEQPELHLHPALQARLADLFVSMTRLSRERNFPIRFVLETHSPTIIERIGQLVEAGHLKPDDVQVLLFARGQTGAAANTATVRRAEFDGGGVLRDWPFGFLSPPAVPVPAFSIQPDSASVAP